MSEHKEVKVNVDTVLLTLKDGSLHVAVAPREAEYLRGKLALVGAIMDGDDPDLDSVVVRSLRDKAGLEGVYFEQLYTFSGRSTKDGKRRDHRWPSVSVAYIALVPLSKIAAEGAQAHGLTLYPVDAVPELPFDHNDIVDAAVSRLRGKGAWSVLPAYLLDDEFTMSELYDVYVRVVDRKMDRASFHRKVIANDIIESVGRRHFKANYRQVEYFRIKKGISTVDFKFGTRDGGA
jgi:hypothetical protein